MNLSRPFVVRPIGTVLLTACVALAGIAGFFALPVASLPQIDLPVISVNASIPGASPETMATSVATPLERYLGTIAGVNEITSVSSVGATRVTLQFDLRRDIDGAARDVQAAISASRIDLPATLRANPTYRKVNPSAAPVMNLALTTSTTSSTATMSVISISCSDARIECVRSEATWRSTAAGSSACSAGSSARTASTVSMTLAAGWLRVSTMMAFSPL